MKYFLSFVLIGSFLLFVGSYVSFQGFHFEGLPQGSNFANRDVAGMHYRGLLELSESSLQGFESLVFRLKVKSQEWVLRKDRDYFVGIDKTRLIQEYRKLKEEFSVIERILNHIQLKFPRRELPKPFFLDEEKTRLELSKRLASLEGQSRYLNQNEITTIRTRFDFDGCLSQIRSSLLNNQRGLIEIQGSIQESRTTSVFSNLEIPIVQVLKLEHPIAQESRGYSLIQSYVNLMKPIVINPQQEFSFKEWIFSFSFEPLDFELESFEMNGLDIQDFHGLTRLSSLFYESFLVLGFQILEHTNHSSLYPELDYLRAGLDSFISLENDLKVRNSTQEPLIYELELSSDYLIMKISSLAKIPLFELEPMFRQIQYAPILSVLDPELGQGVKEVVRKPLSGLYLRLKRFNSSQGFEEELEVEYEPVDGLIRIGQGGMQIFDPEANLEIPPEN